MRADPWLEREHRRARVLIREGDLQGALKVFRELLREVQQPSEVFDAWVRGFARLAEQLEEGGQAGMAWEYLLEWDAAARAYRGARRHADAARVLSRAGAPAQAAQAWGELGFQVHAAVAWERAGELGSAASAWRRARAQFDRREDRYATALCQLNLGLAEHRLGQASAPANLASAAVLLEEEADDAEREGAQDRALACFRALVHLGEVLQRHEHLAEGYLNLIRLLKEREQRLFALQYYNDFATHSLELGEAQAAAEVLREASGYCKRKGLLYRGSFLIKAAQAFEATAVAHLATGSRPELAENALLAALDCYNQEGDMPHVRATYEKLGELGLSAAHRERYQQLAQTSLGESGRREAWPFRGYFSKRAAYPETWTLDLLERDEAKALLGPVAWGLGNLRLWDVVRRRCLLILMQNESVASRADPAAWQRELALQLGRLGAPVGLRPLTQLYEQGQEELRRIVATSLRFLPFRATLALLSRCLDDVDASVREAALQGMRYLVFPAAFGPMLKLYRDHPEPTARRETVLALGRLAGLSHGMSLDAMDFLLHTLREGGAPESVEEALHTAIAANAGERDLGLFEGHALSEPEGPTRKFLERIIVKLETGKMTRPLGV